MKTFQQEIEASFANRLAARYNERYCKAREDMTAALNSGDKCAFEEHRNEADFVADLFDDYRAECEKLGIELTVELDYEGCEA